MSQAIPLVNSSQMASRANQEVRIIGRVMKVRYDGLIPGVWRHSPPGGFGPGHGGSQVADGACVHVDMTGPDACVAIRRSDRTRFADRRLGDAARPALAWRQLGYATRLLTLDLSLVEHLVVLTPQYPTLFSE